MKFICGRVSVARYRINYEEVDNRFRSFVDVFEIKLTIVLKSRSAGRSIILPLFLAKCPTTVVRYIVRCNNDRKLKNFRSSMQHDIDLMTGFNIIRCTFVFI